MLINELRPQMSLKASPYVETLYAGASRAEKRDGLAIHVYLYRCLVQWIVDLERSK